MANSGAKEDRKRRRRGIRLTLRDFAILEALHTARYLTTVQLMKLFWRESRGGAWGRVKGCQQRLRLLSEHGFVRRIQLPVKRGEGPKPYIYALDRKGAAVLVSEWGIEPGDIDWKPKSHEEHYPFMDHLLETTNLKISLLQACAQIGVALDEWKDEKVLRSVHNADHVTVIGPNGGEIRTAVIPDAYFVLCRDEQRSLFFVEVDLKSVTVAPSIWERRGWTRKMRAYLAYFRSDTYRTKYEGRRARVLTVTSGRMRMDNLVKATARVFEESARAGEDTSDRNRFWFAVLGADTEPANLLTAPIWTVLGSDAPHALLE